MIDLNDVKAKAVGIKIMHLDASAKFLENSSLLLHKIFDTVFSISKGYKALEIFQIESPQIVLTELELADLNVIELIKTIQKISPTTHIVVITSHDTKENLIHLIPLHIANILIKPINATMLLATLSEIIETIQKNKDIQTSPNQYEQITVNENIVQQNNTTICCENSLESLYILYKSNKVVHLHNYYKGLSVTNNAYIIDVGANHITLKMNNLQQKAIQYEGKTILSHDNLSKPFLCTEILKMDFNHEFVTFKNFTPQDNTPINRKYVRIDFTNPHTVTLMVNDHPFLGNISIQDISIDAVKLSLDALPAGIHQNNYPIVIKFDIQMESEHLVLSSNAKYLREDENDSSYSVVFLLDFDAAQKSELVKFIAKKQMELIREFKRLTYEQ